MSYGWVYRGQAKKNLYKLKNTTQNDPVNKQYPLHLFYPVRAQHSSLQHDSNNKLSIIEKLFLAGSYPPPSFSMHR